MLMVTTETIPGRAIERVLGLVEASSIWGVRAARRKVTRKARRMGANAIVGTRYVGGGAGSVSGTVFYGTAVVVGPLADVAKAHRSGNT
jgi:uncharacterized protein YbjQ (UPF0145 family)